MSKICEKYTKLSLLFCEKAGRKFCSICPDFSFSTLVFIFEFIFTNSDIHMLKRTDISRQLMNFQRIIIGMNATKKVKTTPMMAP
jgi:hypothetical protein